MKYELATTPGQATANKRYGAPTENIGKPSIAEQEVQCPEDKHGPKYDNDTPSTWVRGMPDACAKPGFDYTKKGQ